MYDVAFNVIIFSFKSSGMKNKLLYQEFYSKQNEHFANVMRNIMRLNANNVICFWKRDICNWNFEAMVRVEYLFACWTFPGLMTRLQFPGNPYHVFLFSALTLTGCMVSFSALIFKFIAKIARFSRLEMVQLNYKKKNIQRW